MSTRSYIAFIADATASRALAPRRDQHAARPHSARDGRALLPRSPRRHGARQAAASGVRVRPLPARARAAGELLLRALLELDPAPAPRGDPPPARLARGRGGRTRGRPERRVAPRPPHGLASRRGRG